VRHLVCNHRVGLKIVGKCLPRECNGATLTEALDQYGLPVPPISYWYCDHDRKLIAHSLSFMRQALGAAGAAEVWDETDDTCHLNGTARMGDDPQSNVVNADRRSWDIPNLWVCNGSMFPIVGGVNPSLTVQAIAGRTADRIRTPAARGELRELRNLASMLIASLANTGAFKKRFPKSRRCVATVRL
jgi:choline dehydrogenase-like flavoprotein